METSFLYMDEFYSDHRTFKHERSKNRPEYVALTGLYVPAGIRSEYRSRFYRAVATALDIPLNTIPSLPQIHGSALFPDRPDEIKFWFLEEVVKACVEFRLEVVRYGYFVTPELKELMPTAALLSLSFNEMLRGASSLKTTEVWPVMESDQSEQQDSIFAGSVQMIDFVTTHVGGSLTIDNSNLGEMLYCTKRSIYGTTVDLISYLLDARLLRQLGIAVTSYKQKLATIAAILDPIILRDEIGTFTIEAPSKNLA